MDGRPWLESRREAFRPQNDDAKSTSGAPFTGRAVNLERMRRACAPENYQFALPTEAQWEYACRAGSSEPYALEPLEDCAWFADNSDGRYHEVARKAPNAWGLRDMHGNLWEWTSDGVEESSDAPSRESAVDPRVDSSAPFHVLKGGSAYDPAEDCRSAVRATDAQELNYDNIGARLALIPKAPPPQDRARESDENIDDLFDF